LQTDEKSLKSDLNLLLFDKLNNIFTKLFFSSFDKLIFCDKSEFEIQVLVINAKFPTFENKQ
jgi:hypothetical protein